MRPADASDSQTPLLLPPSLSPKGAWTGLFAAAGLLQSLLLVVGVLWPPRLRQALPPIGVRKEQIAVVLGENAHGAVHFGVVVVLLTATYLLAVIAAHRSFRQIVRLLALAFPLAFVAILLGTAPLGTKDVYHYVAEGRIWAHYGTNPLTTVPKAYPDDPLLAASFPWEDVASRYGPAWAFLTYLPARLGGDNFVGNLLAMKGLIALFYLLAALLCFTFSASGCRQATGQSLSSSLPGTHSFFMTCWSMLIMTCRCSPWRWVPSSSP